MYIHTCAYASVCICMYMYIKILINRYLYTYMRVWICLFIHLCIYVHFPTAMCSAPENGMPALTSFGPSVPVIAITAMGSFGPLAGGFGGKISLS